MVESLLTAKADVNAEAAYFSGQTTLEAIEAVEAAAGVGDLEVVAVYILWWGGS